MAPSPTPWMMCTVYQDAACSIPWAPRTERWYRLDACGAVNDGGSFWKSSGQLHAPGDEDILRHELHHPGGAINLD